MRKCGGVGVVVAALVLAACGGSDDPSASTPATELSFPDPFADGGGLIEAPEADPATASTDGSGTAAPATDDAREPGAPMTSVEVPADGAIVAAGGVLTLTVPDGWDVTSLWDTVGVWIEDEPGLEWEGAADTLDPIVNLAVDGSVVEIVREARFATAPDLETWADALVALAGLDVDSDEAVDWAGVTGRSVSGTVASGAFTRLDAITVGGQYFAALTRAPESFTDAFEADLDALLGSSEIDTGIIPLLAHSVSLGIGASAEETGSTPFEAALLVPADWTIDPETGEAFAPDETGAIAVDLVPATDPLDVLVAAELEARGTELLGEDATSEAIPVDGVPFEFHGNGEELASSDVIAAMGTDGVVFLAVYVATPGDPTLAVGIANSLRIDESAVEGG